MLRSDAANSHDLLGLAEQVCVDGNCDPAKLGHIRIIPEHGFRFDRMPAPGNCVEADAFYAIGVVAWKIPNKVFPFRGPRHASMLSIQLFRLDRRAEARRYDSPKFLPFRWGQNARSVMRIRECELP
jgi:hypothetical protein